MDLSWENFEQAHEKVREFLEPSPLIFNEWLSRIYDCEVYLKLENLLPVGSFKIRGALNKIASLNDQERQAGVLAVSAGNHAQGVAWAARKLGCSCDVIMPANSPLTKIQRTRSLGANVILHGDTFYKAFDYAQEYLKDKNKVFIHPFKDELVIAGQGSMGFEIKKQLDEVDFLFCSIGGGGLTLGLAKTLDKLSPKTKIYASQSRGTHSMVESLNKGEITQVDYIPTIADGIKVQKPDPQMFELLKGTVDKTFIVEESAIAVAIMALLENTSMMVEGAGAINLAALNELYKKNPEEIKGKKVLLIICGGNIDTHVLERVIEKGLFIKKRRARFKFLMNDVPGELNRLTTLLYTQKVNVLDVSHQRETEWLRFDQSIVNVLMEFRDEEHFNGVKVLLESEFEIDE